MFAALCDDDKYIIEELKKLLLTYAKENRIIIDIDEFESGEKLLNSENNYDIIMPDFSQFISQSRNALVIINLCVKLSFVDIVFIHISALFYLIVQKNRY